MVIFVIPAYNEEENLEHLFDNVRKFMAYFEHEYRVILVNDGSTDGTVEVVQRLQKTLPITLVNHAQNHGPGHAFMSGFHVALDMAADDDMVVTIEADNTSDLLILNKMLEQCRRGHDLVLASVYGKGKVVGAPLNRKVLSWCANSMLKMVLQIKGVHTFSSFFRVYRAAMLKQAMALYQDRLMEEAGFACMVELLVKLHRLGYRIVEVPMLLDSKIRVGESKMKAIRTTISYFKLMYRYGIAIRFTPMKDALGAYPHTGK
jgi:dolichol-phosphate mannosyltransferase